MLDRTRDVGGARIEILDPRHRRALRGRDLLQRISHQVAVWRIRRERGKFRHPLAMREGDFARDLLAWQETHQEDVTAGDLGLGREGNDVDVSGLRDRLHRHDLIGDQRPENQPSPVGDHRSRRAGSAVGRAGRVTWDQRQLIAAGGEERELRRLEHRLAEVGVRARERQKQSDLDRAIGSGWQRRRRYCCRWVWRGIG